MVLSTRRTWGPGQRGEDTGERELSRHAVTTEVSGRLRSVERSQVGTRAPSAYGMVGARIARSRPGVASAEGAGDRARRPFVAPAGRS